MDPRYPPGPPVGIETTISDDRTSDGAFERTGQQWAALKPNNLPNTYEHQFPSGYYGDPPPPVQVINAEPRKPQRRSPHIARLQPFSSPMPNRPHAAPDSRERQDASNSANKEAASEGIQDVTHSTAPARQNGDQNDARWQEPLIRQSLGTVGKLLGIPDYAAADLESMKAYISNAHGNESAPHTKTEIKPEYLEVHCVMDQKLSSNPWIFLIPDAKADSSQTYRMYLDRPRWRAGARMKQEALLGDLPVASLERYLSKNPEICFVVLKQYDASARTLSEGVDDEISAPVSHVSEALLPATRPMTRIMADFAAFLGYDEDHKIAYAEVIRQMRNHTRPDDETDSDSSSTSYTSVSTVSTIPPDLASDALDYARCRIYRAPYLAIYHARGEAIDKFTETIQGIEATQFNLLLHYIMYSFEDEYNAVDAMVARGKICNAYLAYLFRPGTVVVSGKGHKTRGYMCTSEVSADEAGKLYVSCWHWELTHIFEKSPIKRLFLASRQPNSGFAEQDIDNLDTYPLAFVSTATNDMLKNRGQWFWKCRGKQMVSYRSETGKKSHYASDKRYMIDMQVYRELHKKGSWRIDAPRPSWMDEEQPPDKDFSFLAPLTIQGYNLKTKKWQDLNIDGLSDVVWNTSAFDSLVLDGKTKRLIQALISNQIEAEMSTDIIDGKGNGLIMLLHGGPGTGKTLTAESVAEIARRPLYPVTCGDIGTEASSVEKYLESVLHLGKTWGCVVLLDEADVFLEQRSLEDLHRNALVSVFLRVLEYYDGILVLTSNRVGTFDEAFRSRIQLAIHYTSLTTHQRTKIWENFFTRLEKLNEEGIDFLDLKDHVDKLAEHKMNGREIRNVITTARQFARWERKQPGGERYRLDYKVMEEVIETSGKFDKYIAKLNGGFTSEQLAEDEGLRLANAAE